MTEKKQQHKKKRGKIPVSYTHLDVYKRQAVIIIIQREISRQYEMLMEQRL